MHRDFLEAFEGSGPPQQGDAAQCTWLLAQQQSTTRLSVIFQYLLPLFHHTYCLCSGNTTSEVETRVCWSK